MWNYVYVDPEEGYSVWGKSKPNYHFRAENKQLTFYQIIFFIHYEHSRATLNYEHDL